MVRESLTCKPLTETILTMETLSRDLMIGMLRTGANGAQILEILDAITSVPANADEAQETEVSA